MNKKGLPAINSSLKFADLDNRIEQQIYSRWNPNIKAAAEDDNVVTIYEPIGYDYWTESGFTVKRMAGALRAIGKDKDVVVSINSPGGDFFEGAAIYNLLREHKGKVTVKIVGLAASAASIIAMAGDVIQIADIGFLMIHDVWSCVCGNRNDLREIADTFETFDQAIADVYAARSGQGKEEIMQMMDKGTWLNAADAIEKGFADEKMHDKIDEGDKKDDKKTKAMARRAIEMALAKEGVSRKDREELLNKAFGARDAAGEVLRDADEKDKLKELLTTITGG